MLKTESLTLEELEFLLRSRFNAGYILQYRLQERVQRDLGEKPKKDEPQDSAIKDLLLDKTAELFARRLKLNDQSIPLLSAEDPTSLVPVIADGIEEQMGSEFSEHDRKAFQKLAEGLIQHHLEAVQVMIPISSDPYKEHGRWIATVLDLAQERDVSAIELMTFEDVHDEISRRTFTKEELSTTLHERLKRIMDSDRLLAVIPGPMIDAMAAVFDDEERLEMKREFMEQYGPKFKAIMERYIGVAHRWIEEEVERIYS